jgi:Rhs element Vgr protein
VGGAAVPRAHQLLAVSVVNTANHVASARLVYRDGTADTSDFTLSNDSLFVPGAEIEIQAGAGAQMDTLFKGIVVRQRLKVREQSASQLIVECRHMAAKLTLKRHSVNHLDKTDSDIITALLGEASIHAKVESTSGQHKHLVQYDTTDWDFLVTRAQANGHLVLTRGADIETRKLALQGSTVATLQYGSTLIELDAEVDAREQTKAVKTLTWNAADQAVHTMDGTAPSFTGPGNLSPDELADAVGVGELELRHAMLPDDEATAAADARFASARLNKVSGRVKCDGLGQVQPGDVVALAGVGERFNGQVLVTGVRHEMDMVQGWKTHLQFGGVPEDPERRARLQAARTPSLLAPVHGLQIGIVTDNEDPDSEFRIRIKLPLVDSSDGVWARLASLDAGKDRGFVVRPEIGDEVVVGFLDDDPRSAVVLGMLHSSAKPAPIAGSNDNHEKAFVSRSGMKVHFNDDKIVMTLSTPGGHSFVLDDDKGAITLTDSNGNTIVLDDKGITVESCKDLKVKTSADTAYDIGGKGEFKTSTDFKVEAGAQLQLSGSAGAALQSSATVKVAGSLVQIN